MTATWEKPKVGKPVVDNLADISSNALSQLVSYLDQFNPTISVDNVAGAGLQARGGTSTQTPGAVAVVTIAHGLGGTPTAFSAFPASVNARGAPLYHLTADATNVTLNFVANLAAATAYSWVWLASA